jgi:hypothetical protein
MGYSLSSIMIFRRNGRDWLIGCQKEVANIIGLNHFERFAE